MSLYLNCINTVLTVEAFQARNDLSLSYGDRVNTKFYTAMILPFLIDANIKDQRSGEVCSQKLSLLDTSKITDRLLKLAQDIAFEAYTNCGGNDNAAKSSDMLKKALELLAEKLPQ